MTIEYVDVATARSAPGVRIVVSGLVPSRTRDASDVTAWTGVDNVPVVFHGAEPARTNWAAITALAARLAGPGVVLPDELAARADTVGLLHEIAGEVPDELWAHRALVFERHLAWPIAL